MSRLLEAGSIGAGQARRSVEVGLSSAAVMEPQDLGGYCANTGCAPTNVMGMCPNAAHSMCVPQHSRFGEKHRPGDCHVPLKVGRRRAKHQKVEYAKEFLIGNLRRGATLAELAIIVDLSPHHLLRAFRSVVGLTPYNFLTQMRVERAKHLLGCGRAISDVAVDTGFVDQAHLTRRFKALVGVTPGRYRITSRSRRLL